jgi:signal transduction histidine kinase
MTVAAPSKSGLYREYRRAVEGEPLARSLRTAVFVLFVIQSVFILVDWLLYPAQFSQFLPIRMALNLFLGVVYFWSSRKAPLVSSFLTALAGGGMLLAVVHGTGGSESGYYVGLVLLLFGMGVLAPLSGKQAAALAGSLFGAYAAIPLILEQQVEWEVFSLHLFFLGAAAFGGSVSCALLDRMRFADFCQRREIELARDELRALDREKSRFTANIHHELRTPLTLTLAPIEAFLGGDFGEISELQRGYLKSMHSNAQRLLKLINNLLDLAKIEGDQLSITRVPTSLERLISDLLSGARPLAEQKGVGLSMTGFETLPVVNVDRDAIEKVLVNLIGNALKFTESGDQIEVDGKQGGEDSICLSVIDSGMGIPEKDLGRIFDRFAQVDSSGTRKHEGTGIGLALAQELLELHGGRISAESDGVGFGTTIRVVLPIGDPDEELDEEVIHTSEGKDVSLAKSFAAMESELDLGAGGRGDQLVEMERTVERSMGRETRVKETRVSQSAPADAPEVLVVEDNVDMRRLLYHLIGKEFRVRLAINGRDGLEKAKESAPDLILTDVMMPEMTGTELCAAIKGDPELQRIPVIIVTSKAEREMKIQGLELGAEDYVTKPFHPRELLARVRGVVRVRRLQEALEVQNAALEVTNTDLERALGELREAHVQLVQAERLAAVGELAAGVAHEVNNPVNFATNALRTLRMYVADVQEVAAKVAELRADDPSLLVSQLKALEKLRKDLDFEGTASSLGELVGIVTEGLERTHRLVGDLRDFAAPGDGAQGEVDLRRGLDSTIQLIRFELRKVNVEVEIDAPERLPTLEGDSRALNQVFLNLLKNAAEAYTGRAGTVWVRMCHEGDLIVVEIRDDGAGIAPELHARIFEPFFTTKEAGRGTGLGLSISRRIVSEHGGSISVESVPGEGTCFRIELPLRSAGHAA